MSDNILLENIGKLSQDDAQIVWNWIAANLGLMRPAETLPALKSASHWIDAFSAAYAQEKADYYDKWSKSINAVYQSGYPVRALGAVWVASQDDQWLMEALRLAITVMGTIQTAGQIKHSLYWFMFARSLTWLLLEMKQRGGFAAHQADWDALLAFAVQMWDDYFYTPHNTNDGGHVLMTGYFLSQLDPENASKYQSGIAIHIKEIPSQYASYPQGDWRLLYDDDSSRHDPQDTSHAQHEIEAIRLLLDAKAGIFTGDQLAYAQRAFWRCFDRDAGQFAKYVDGSGGESPSPAHYGWANLGATDPAIQRALEGYHGDLYMGLWYAMLAENAARLGT